MRSRWMVWACAACVCAGCVGMRSGSGVSPLALPTQVPARGMVVVALPTVEGDVEEAPVLVLRVSLVDGQTGQPVVGDVYLVAGEAWRDPVAGERVLAEGTGVDVLLPGTFTGWLVVDAEGYAYWRLRVSYHVERSRTLDAPVELQRVGSGIGSS